MDAEVHILSQARKPGEFIKGQRAAGLEIVTLKPEAGKTQMFTIVWTEHAT